MLDQKFLSVEEALSLLFSYLSFKSLPSEEIPIEESYNRVLYEDLFSPEDLPGFDRSTVDGFAVKASDTFGAKETSPVYLRLKGEIPMGEVPKFTIESGEAAMIATGGMLPLGADAVVMLEQVNVISSDLIEILKPVAPGENVIFKDEDVKKGELVLPAGHKLKPQDVGALAGLGISKVKVIKKPIVPIILTGDEIIPHFEKISPGKVRDINSFTLAGLIEEVGGIPLKMGIVKDKYEEIKKVTKEAFEKGDMVLITGGTSAGTKDMVAKIIEDMGNPGIIFHGVSIKPGKPLIAGICQGKPIFGLPGHPVAVFICFKLFVEPVLKRMMGIKIQEFKSTIRAKMGRSVSSQAGRMDFIRVALEKRGNEVWASPLLSKSGLIMSLVKAQGIVTIPPFSLGLEEGEEVEVEII